MCIRDSSQGIIINKSFLQHLSIDEEVELELCDEGLLMKPVQKSPRQGWDEQFQAAIAKGELPEGELLEGFSNDFETKGDWTW